MQSAEDDLGPPLAIPASQFISPLSKREVDSNAHHFGKGIRRGDPCNKFSSQYETVQSRVWSPRYWSTPGWGQDVFAKTGMRVLSVKRIQQQSRPLLTERGQNSGSSGGATCISTGIHNFRMRPPIYFVMQSIRAKNLTVG